MNRLVLVTCIVLGAASAANAAANRTFVASTGLDTNPCSRTAPCRSFGAAVAQTSAGGTVLVLDSAGYGPVTIAQSVAIIAPPGVYAGVTATGGNAIIISGTAASDTVTLRGLSVESVGAFSGIFMITNPLRTLYVQQCFIRGFSDWGIYYEPSNPGSVVFVEDTTVSNCGIGVYPFGGSGQVSTNPEATIDHCRVEENSYGIWFDSAGGTVTNTIAGSNGATGFRARSSEMTLDHCVTSNNATGIQSDGAVVRVTNTTIVDNLLGLAQSNDGGILTRVTGDLANPVKTNTLQNNATPGAFTGTFTAE
jgi:hypothetical protein